MGSENKSRSDLTRLPVFKHPDTPTLVAHNEMDLTAVFHNYVASPQPGMELAPDRRFEN
jgi:hypothetical protein